MYSSPGTSWGTGSRFQSSRWIEVLAIGRPMGTAAAVADVIVTGWIADQTVVSVGP